MTIYSLFPSYRTTFSALVTAFKVARRAHFNAAFQPLCHGSYSRQLPMPLPLNYQRRYIESSANVSGNARNANEESEDNEHIIQQEEKVEDEAVDLTEKIAELEGKLAEATENLKELQLKYRLCLDNCEQIERIGAKKLHNAEMYAITQFARDMLDVADAFELAFKSLGKQKDAAVNTQFIEGIKLTEVQLHKTFEKYGIKRFESVNQVFNPEVHEAMFEIEDASVERNTILQVIFNGYMIKDRVLRAAKVGVSRK